MKEESTKMKQPSLDELNKTVTHIIQKIWEMQTEIDELKKDAEKRKHL